LSKSGRQRSLIAEPSLRWIVVRVRCSFSFKKSIVADCFAKLLVAGNVVVGLVRLGKGPCAVCANTTVTTSGL
jgi:hypothetical protein